MAIGRVIMEVTLNLILMAHWVVVVVVVFMVKMEIIVVGWLAILVGQAAVRVLTTGK
jgi:hypothetical protein